MLLALRADRLAQLRADRWPHGLDVFRPRGVRDEANGAAALAAVSQRWPVPTSVDAVLGQRRDQARQVALEDVAACHARTWAIGQTVAWAVDSTYLPTHIETAGWLVEA